MLSELIDTDVEKSTLIKTRSWVKRREVLVYILTIDGSKVEWGSKKCFGRVQRTLNLF